MVAIRLVLEFQSGPCHAQGLSPSLRPAQDLSSILLVSRAEVMVDRDSWGHSYLTVRGEILGFVKDGLLRKHLPRMFSLIKNES